MNHVYMLLTVSAACDSTVRATATPVLTLWDRRTTVPRLVGSS
jgi:hypothetical protein